MARTAMKRAASATSRGPGRPPKVAKVVKVAKAPKAPKAKKEDSVMTCIVKALKFAEKKDVPAGFTERLGPVLRQSLAAAQDERHELQGTVVEMAAKVLRTAEEALVEEVARLETTVANSDQERKDRDAAVVAAEQKLAECQEALKEAQDAKADKVRAFKASLELLKEIQANQKTEDAEGEALDQKKGEFEKCLTDYLAPLKEASGGRRQLQVLVKQLSTFELEDSLLEAIKLPLAKKPESRGRLDAVILEQLDLQLEEKRAALDAKLQDIAPARDARAASVQAAQDAHDQAKAASEEAVEALKAAKEAEATAKVDLAAAKESSKSLTSELLQAAQQLDNAQNHLEGFRSGPLAAFNELKERTAPVPEPEPSETIAAEGEGACEGADAAAEAHMA